MQLAQGVETTCPPCLLSSRASRRALPSCIALPLPSLSANSYDARGRHRCRAGDAHFATAPRPLFHLSDNLCHPALLLHLDGSTDHPRLRVRSARIGHHGILPWPPTATPASVCALTSAVLKALSTTATSPTTLCSPRPPCLSPRRLSRRPTVARLPSIVITIVYPDP